jgi:iron complex outermembrane recepter protein
MSHLRASLLLSATAVGALFAMTAQAQEMSQLEEVVVTAERTESTVQKTPISIAVVSGEELRSSGVSTLAQLNQVEPTIVFNSGQFNGATITIRGVSSSGSTSFGGSAVTINTDGQYIYSGFNGVLFDVARVEVLKGPQGTLYGLNSTAGAINILTNAPTLDAFGGEISVDVGNYATTKFSGAVNIPLSDTLGVRVAAYSQRQEGYRTHPGMKATDYVNVDAVRGSVLWQPIEAFDLRVTGEFSKEDRGNTVQQGVIIPVTAANPAGRPPRNFTSAGVDPRNWPLNYDGFNRNEIKSIRAQASYDFGFATLTYLGGYRTTNNPLSQPAFGTRVQVVDFDQVKFRNKTIQHEARLNGDTDFGLKWQVGGFYSNYETAAYVNIFNTATAAFAPPRTAPFLRFDNFDINATSKAAYGQVTQTVTDKLSLTAGIRYTTSDQQSNTNTEGLNAGAFFGSQGAVRNYVITPSRLRNDFEKTTWRLGVDYQATPGTLFYASAGTSFKDGGVTQFNSFAPEEITAYEIGTKNRLFSNRLELNAAAFFYDYTNQQAQVFVLQPNGATALTTFNAGASEVRGAEVTGTWLITDNDTLRFSAAYTDAEFTEFTAAQPVIPLGAVTAVQANLAGNKPPQAPEWTLTAGYDRVWNIGEGSLVASFSTRYLTDYYLSVFNLPGDKVESFMQSDASLTYTAPNDAWDVSAFVRNIEDNDTLTTAQFLIGGNGVPIYLFGWAPPRTYGVRVGARF